MGAETWFYYHDPESHCESMEMKPGDSPKSRMLKITRTTKELIITWFWDSEVMIKLGFWIEMRQWWGNALLIYFPRCRYLEIEKERQGKFCHGVRLQYDNTPVHTNTQAKLPSMLLPRPPYFVDLAPSHYFRVFFFQSRKMSWGVRDLLMTMSHISCGGGLQGAQLSFLLRGYKWTTEVVGYIIESQCHCWM